VPARDEALEKFLAQTVQLSTALLLAGILRVRLVEKGTPIPSDETPAQAVKKLRRLTATDLRNRVLEIACSAAHDWEAVRTLEAFVDPRSEHSYRVDYNLACYYAGELGKRGRDAARRTTSQTDKTQDEMLANALNYLKAAFQKAPPVEVQLLAEWAWRDPSLERLRLDHELKFKECLKAFTLPKR
jgi:hypothetical protein